MAGFFRYYRALLTQTGTSDPVAKDLDNTIGRIVWKRTGVGTYTASKSLAFRQYKTLPVRDAYVDIDGNYMTMEWTDMNTMTLKTYAASDVSTLADGILSDQFVNIETYF